MHEHDPGRTAPAWLTDGRTAVVDEVLGVLKTGKEAEVFIVEQLIGDDGVAAPRLVHARLSSSELGAAHEQLVDELRRLTRAGLVHADLSPFNVLWWRGRLWLIDFPQAVDLVLNPHGFDLLHHDVTTMCTWFTRQGLDSDPEAIFADLLAEAW